MSLLGFAALVLASSLPCPSSDLDVAVEDLLACSRRYATLLSSPQPDLATLHSCDYPTDEPRGVIARLNLLAHPREAAPLVLRALEAVDPRTYEGTAAGKFCNDLLVELFHGGFQWGQLLSEDWVARNEQTRKGWRLTLDLVLSEDAFWKDVRAEARRRFSAVEGFVACESVLPAGASIRARTREGEVEYVADTGFGRSITWKGATRTVQMIPRPERWNGSLGLYFPGSGNHWKPHEGITRATVEEKQIHLDSLEEFESWLKSSGQDFVHRNDGLLVAFSLHPGRKQLSLDVVQVYIAGQRPKELPGASDDAISCTGF